SSDLELLGMFFLSPAFGNLSGKHQRRQRLDGKERLQQKQRIVGRWARKRPVTMCRADYRNRAHQADNRRGFARSKPECRPNQKRDRKKRPGIISDFRMQQWTENDS